MQAKLIFELEFLTEAKKPVKQKTGLFPKEKVSKSDLSLAKDPQTKPEILDALLANNPARKIKDLVYLNPNVSVKTILKYYPDDFVTDIKIEDNPNFSLWLAFDPDTTKDLFMSINDNDHAGHKFTPHLIDLLYDIVPMKDWKAQTIVYNLGSDHPKFKELWKYYWNELSSNKKKIRDLLFMAGLVSVGNKDLFGMSDRKNRKIDINSKDAEKLFTEIFDWVFADPEKRLTEYFVIFISDEGQFIPESAQKRLKAEYNRILNSERLVKKLGPKIVRLMGFIFKQFE